MSAQIAVNHTVKLKWGFDEAPRITFRTEYSDRVVDFYVVDLAIEVSGDRITLDLSAYRTKKDGTPGNVYQHERLMPGANKPGHDERVAGILRQLHLFDRQQILENVRLAAPVAHFTLAPKLVKAA